MRREGHFEKGEVVYLALFLFSIFFLSIFKIKSYDLWWHIKAGESIVGAGLKPAPTNIFSWTEPDHPWINFSWLFDVTVYFIHKAAGFNGLIIFQAALVTAVFFVVYKTSVSILPPPLSTATPLNPLFNKEGKPTGRGVSKEGAGGRYGIFALFLIAYFAARFRFSLRPHLLALLFFAIDIYLLNRLSTVSSRRSANSDSPIHRFTDSPFYLIPLIQILWANVHGSAIVGVLLPLIYIVGRAVPANHRQSVGPPHPTFLILLTLFASLLNPYGYKVLTDPFMPFFGKGADLFNVLTVDEWQMSSKDMFLGCYGLLLAIGVASFFPRFVETPRRGVSTDLLLFSTFALLSIKAVRFIDLFVVAAVPVIYRNLADFTPPFTPSLVKRGPGGVRALSRLTPIFLLVVVFTGIKDTTFNLGLGIDKEVISQKAVEFMERNGIRGKIFNSYNFGGYLIYKGYPVFIDGRLCYSPELVKDFADANLMRGWKRIEERYMPDVVLIEYDKPAIPEGLIIDKENWALVYWDDLDMLFLKRNDKFSAIIDRNEYRALNPMDMYGRGGFPSPGGRGLRGGGTMNIHPHPHPDPLPSRERGDILFWDKAIFTEAQRKIKDGPESMRAHLLLGNLYMKREELSEAISEYKAVIDSPLTFGKAEAHNNLGTAYEMVGDVYRAEDEYKAAIRLDRAYPLPQRNLGYLKLGQSDYVEALWHLERYLQMDKGDRDTWAAVSELKRYRDNLILRVLIGGGAVIGILWIAARRFRRDAPPGPLYKG